MAPKQPRKQNPCAQGGAGTVVELQEFQHPGPGRRVYYIGRARSILRGFRRTKVYDTAERGLPGNFSAHSTGYKSQLRRSPHFTYLHPAISQCRNSMGPLLLLPQGACT